LHRHQFWPHPTVGVVVVSAPVAGIRRKTVTNTGEPFVWAAYVLPVWIVFLTIDVTWGSIIVTQRRWSDGRIWLLTCVVWMLAIIVDFSHH
jgi:hypothetical protein